ncbi:MAG: trypsin-like peptidase domain-containing protein [Acidobacteriota bacterium]
MKRLLIAVCVLFVVAVQVEAQRNEPFFMRDAVGVKSYPAAPRIAQSASMVPATLLPAAESTIPEAIEAIREWNESGRQPMRNGFKRALPDLIELKGEPVQVAKTGVRRAGRGLAVKTDHGTSIWSTVVKVEKAHRLRLHLENCVLPEGAVLWVYGAGEAPIAFGRELLDDKGGLWTPATDGETVWLEIETPAASAAAFTIREVLEIVDLAARSVRAQDAPTCLVDSTCVNSSTFDVITAARRAVAQLQFVTSEGGAVCSGGLLNDRNNTGTPYLLTAHHCFSTQSEASSLDAYFDFVSSACNGPFNRSTAPRTHGATLLATSSINDFTFVRLNSAPAGRALLGWDSAVPANGTKLYRLSHPFPSDDVIRPQMYSSTLVNISAGVCEGLPRSSFIYSSASEGGTYGGSSGSPVMLAGGRVVGQLLGSCGPEPKSGCDPRNSKVDGAFSLTYPNIAQWLEGNPAQPVACTQNATTMCLVDNRFEVTAAWQTSNNSGAGQAVRLTGDTGYFWFFGSSNVEAVIKVLNACPLNQRFWVFAGGLTNVRVVLTVRDTKTGTVKTYTNPLDTAFVPIQDTSAFATCP